MKKASSILVVRVGKLDAEDPLDALRVVIAQHGYSWFGKYGRPIGDRCFSPNMLDVVCIAYRRERKYVLTPFRRLAVSRTPPPDLIYPAYYSRLKSRISTWIKLAPIDLPAFTLDDFQVSSSGLNLVHAFQSSMSSHFLCRFRTTSHYDLFAR